VDCVRAAQLGTDDSHPRRDAPEDPRLGEGLIAARGMHGANSDSSGVVAGRGWRCRAGVERGDVDDLVEERRQLVQLAHGRTPSDDPPIAVAIVGHV